MDPPVTTGWWLAALPVMWAVMLVIGLAWLGAAWAVKAAYRAWRRKR